jgi:hypothetical protein
MAWTREGGEPAPPKTAAIVPTFFQPPAASNSDVRGACDQPDEAKRRPASALLTDDVDEDEAGRKRGCWRWRTRLARAVEAEVGSVAKARDELAWAATRALSSGSWSIGECAEVG